MHSHKENVMFRTVQQPKIFYSPSIFHSPHKTLPRTEFLLTVEDWNRIKHLHASHIIKQLNAFHINRHLINICFLADKENLIYFNSCPMKHKLLIKDSRGSWEH